MKTAPLLTVRFPGIMGLHGDCAANNRLSYMKGEVSTAKNIDQSVYVASVQPTEELRAALQDEVAAAAPPAKRPRVEDGALSTDAADASAAPAAMEMGVVQKVRARANCWAVSSASIVRPFFVGPCIRWMWFVI